MNFLIIKRVNRTLKIKKFIFFKSYFHSTVHIFVYTNSDSWKVQTVWSTIHLMKWQSRQIFFQRIQDQELFFFFHENLKVSCAPLKISKLFIIATKRIKFWWWMISSNMTRFLSNFEKIILLCLHSRFSYLDNLFPIYFLQTIWLWWHTCKKIGLIDLFLLQGHYK